MSIVEADLQKKAYFQQEAKKVVETKQLFNEIGTKLISEALTVYSPYTSVSAAKNSSNLCVNAVGTATVSKDSITIDRRVSNSLKYCNEELTYANFNQSEMQRQDLYSSIIEKLNKNAAADLVAGATAGSAPVDLSTSDKVISFLIDVKVNRGKITQLAQRVDGARVVRPSRFNKPFVAAGSVAYADILKGVEGKVTLSSTKGMEGEIMDTVYGVTILHVPDAFADPKQMVWGTVGAFTLGFREDNIEVDMDVIKSFDTAVANDGDIAAGDSTYTKTSVLSMAVMTKNKVFANVKSLLTQQKSV